MTEDIVAHEPDGEFVLYRTEDGVSRVQVRLADESVWLTQAQMAELFQTTVPNVSMHIRNIYREGELSQPATLEEYSTVALEGSRRVQRRLAYHNLEVTRPLVAP